LAALQNQDAAVDIIVFDWDLPGMDGPALMGQLKNLGLAGKVSVLFSVNRQQRAPPSPGGAPRRVRVDRTAVH
jgi:CheY-like chemotaxis protein